MGEWQRTSTLFLVLLLVCAPCILADEFDSSVNAPTVPSLGALSSGANYGADTFSGAFYYSYPIAVPKGTNDLTPAVQLVYNSQSTQGMPSVAGTGWMLTQSYIQRDVNGTATNTSDDKFFLTLNGRQYELIYNQTQQQWHTKIESYLEIVNLTPGATGRPYFRVRTTDGTSYTFGNSNQSELVSNLYNYTVRWYLNQVQDVYANRITYYYDKNKFSGDAGAVYPTTIEYNQDNRRRVEFTYGARTDVRTSFRNGNNETYNGHLTSITTKVNYTGNWTDVRRYDLAYASYGAISVLANITEVGNDSTSLPATRFEYFNNSGWTSSTQWQVFYSYAYESDTGVDLGARLVDLNSDGLADYIRRNFVDDNAWLNTGSGLTASASKWKLNDTYAIVNDIGYDQGVRLLDVNGDGRIDVLKRLHANVLGALINNGSGWNDSKTWNISANFAFVKSGVEFADLNGDGLPDVIKRLDGNGTSFDDVGLNNGTGWANSTGIWNLPVAYALYSNNADTGVRIVDLNGDGLPDILKRQTCNDANCSGELLNNANGWSNESRWNLPVEFALTDGGNDTGVRLVDLNGDGLVDVIKRQACSQANCSGVLLNNGSGWTNDTGRWNISSNMPFLNVTVNKAARLADLNGDGLADIIKSVKCPGASCNGTLVNNATNNYQLRVIHYSSGGTTTINYTPSTSFDNTGTDGMPDLPIAISVVTSITTSNGMTDNRAVNGTSTYTYAGGVYKYDRTSSEFRGFRQSTEVTPNSDTIIHRYHQTDELQGKEYATEEYNGSTTLLKNTSRTYQSTMANNVAVVTLDSIKVEEYDGNSTPRTSTTNYTYDAYGNTLTTTSYGDTSITGDEAYARTTYEYNTGNYLVNTKTSDTLLDSDNNTILRQSNYTNNANGDPINTTQYLAGSTIRTTNTYDSYGNVIALRDPRGYTTNMTYESTGTYLANVTNALAQRTQYDYDLGTGNLRSTTDPNGYITTNTFDALGRPRTVIKPYDTTTSPTVQYTYGLDGSAPENLTVTTKLNGSLNQTMTYFLDGRQKLVQVKAIAEGGLFVTQDYTYDAEARLNATSNPYFTTNGTATDLNATNYYNAVTYDALDRPLRVIKPDGTSRNTGYAKDTTTQYDENGHRKDAIKDTRGNILRIIEYNGSQTYTTRYTYDAANQLLRTNDSSTNLITFTYDTLGRKTGMIDPDMGTWNYTYDENNNLIRQRDNRGTNINLSYDALNRITSKNSTNLTTIYSYDTGVKGTLATLQSTSTNLSYAYDQRLRTTQENLTTNGVTFTTSYAYDSSDHLLNTTLPNARTINYTYNVQGLLDSIPGYATAFTYAASGKAKDTVLANGITTKITFFGDTLRPQTIRSANVQNMTYTYDLAGNIISITDALANTSENITYDDLDRIQHSRKAYTNGSAPLIYEFNYSIDALGRINTIISNLQNFTFTYSGTPVHAPNQVNDGGASLSITLITPNTSGNVTQNQFFAATAQTCCTGTVDCNVVNDSLDPEAASEPSETLLLENQTNTSDEPNSSALVVPDEPSTLENASNTSDANTTIPVNEQLAQTDVTLNTTLPPLAENTVPAPDPGIDQETPEAIAQEAPNATPTLPVANEEPVRTATVDTSTLDPHGEYSWAMERHCTATTCTTILYSTPHFGFEGTLWKPLGELRSFKGNIPINCIVNQDGIHQVECVDYNATHRKLRITISDPSVAARPVPVRILTPTVTPGQTPAFVEDLTARRELTFTTPDSVVEEWFPAGLHDEVHVGETSTNVTLVPTNATSFSGWWEATGGSLALYNWTNCDANSYSAGDKTSISDGNSSTSIYGTGGGSATDYTYCHRMKWQIPYDPTNISSITTWAYWAGDLNAGSTSITKALYIGNVTSQSWVKLDSQSTGAPVNHTGNVSGNMSDYVENSAGNYYVYTLLHYNASKAGSTYAYSNFYDTVLILTTGASGGSGGGGKGLVNTTSGATPFYTNGTNPRNITLLAGQCQNTTWYVNATGTVGNTYAFFAYANQTSNPSNSARSSSINLTIVSSGGGGGSLPQLLANYTFTSSNEGFNLGTGWSWDSSAGVLRYNGADWGGNLYSPNLSLSTYAAYNITLVFTSGNITFTKFLYASSGTSLTGDKYHFERSTDTTQHLKHDSAGYSSTDDYTDGNEQTMRIAANFTQNGTRACRSGGTCSNNETVGSFTRGDYLAVSPGEFSGHNLNITTIEVWRTG